MKFAKYGLKELKLYGTISGLITIAALVLSQCLIHKLNMAMLIALPFAFVFVTVVWFFRDPERAIPRGDNRILSPADGVVFDTAHIDHDEFIGGPATRIGIFLSVFDVHVNRAPCSGTVESIVYKRGSFISAMKAAECSAKNESNFVGITNAGGTGMRIGMKQIAGQIARRIVCTLREGDELVRGERFGMIKFGSRAELFLPDSPAVKIKVKLGSHVKGGVTVLAVIEQDAVAEDNHDLEMAELPEKEAIQEDIIEPSEDVTQSVEPITGDDELTRNDAQVTDTRNAPTSEDSSAAARKER